MRTTVIAVALAACIPAAVFAQRGGGASSAADPAPSPAASSSSGAKSPSSRDLSDLNPAAMLVDKRKKVPLADSTVAQLKTIAKKISERNATFFATYDSVRKWTIPLTSSRSSAQSFGLHGGIGDSKMAETTSAAEQAKMQSSMRDLRGLMADYRERRKTDVTDALSVIPEAQKNVVTDLVGQQDGDLDKLIGARP
jgi:hypothetical protein